MCISILHLSNPRETAPVHKQKIVQVLNELLIYNKLLVFRQRTRFRVRTSDQRSNETEQHMMSENRLHKIKNDSWVEYRNTHALVDFLKKSKPNLFFTVHLSIISHRDQ